MPDNPSRREVWEAVVKDEEMRAASLSGRLAAMQARAESAEAKLAAALAEVERVKARLDRAVNFTWCGGSIWVAKAEGSATWFAYEEIGSCGAALIGKYHTLDAAWSAAEAQSARPAAPKGGE